MVQMYWSVVHSTIICFIFFFFPTFKEPIPEPEEEKVEEKPEEEKKEEEAEQEEGEGVEKEDTEVNPLLCRLY